MSSISPCTCRVAAAWSVCVDPSLFMLLPTHITTAPQSNTVTLWRVTVWVTSMKLVGVASVIRVWSPMVYEAVTPDSWMLRVVSGKPLAVQMKVTLSPAAAVTSALFSPLMNALGATAVKTHIIVKIPTLVW